jgi:UDP-N-acetylmuramoyl-tripeptide--D-alanyl-D-alanine ligase
MIAHVLGARLNVLMSEKNFNNEIGVPQTVFQLGPEHQAAVIEMGMRGAGQIAQLADIAAPTIGVITNVGLSHVELLGSREAIAAAKAELLEKLPAAGVAVINADDSYAGHLVSRTSAAIQTYGTSRGASFRATHARFNSSGESTFRINGKTMSVRAPGVHHVINAAAACAVASVLGVSLEEVADRLLTFRPPAMRMEILELEDGTTIINDAYNAAPDSMRSALETLSVMAGSHRRPVAILGDMKELGPESESGHRYVGEQAAARKPALLVTVGKLAGWMADSASSLGSRRIKRFPDTEAAAAEIKDLIKPGDLVLIKGSRAMAMEKIVDSLTLNERKGTRASRKRMLRAP